MNDMKMRWTLLVFPLLLTQLALQAQILPPTPLCLSGDTLRWDLPASPCLPFGAYEIYTGPTAGGPFTLLATVTNPATTQFVHPNPANEPRYYYLRSLCSGPGQASPPSVIISNQQPADAPMQFVSVDGDNVLLSWDPSPSTEVYAYLIYRLVNGNVIPIDTVFNGTIYTDTSAMPGTRSEIYYVLALDPCGNTSIFQNPHSTTFLTRFSEVCSRSIRLQWNRYQNWPQGIGEQQVWVSTNSSAFELAGTVNPQDSIFFYPGIGDGEEYCFYIESFALGSSFSSRSNVVCITAEIIQPPRDLAIWQVDVEPNGSVRIDYVWNDDAQVQSGQIRWQPEGADPAAPLPLPIAMPLLTDNSVPHPGAPSAQGSIEYQLAVVDACDSTTLSNKASTLYIEARAQAADNLNLVEWAALQHEGATATRYELFRILPGGAAQLLGSFAPGEFSYEDPVDPAIAALGPICYYVQAIGTISLPNGEERPIRPRSNIACAEQPIRVFVPNALAPQGINREFKPVIAFGTAAVYQLRIYDRYGKVIFESTDPDIGWTGRTTDGRDAPTATYVYTIQIIQANGQIENLQGQVTLLR
jgi:gliding motility-associated-like protein